MRTAFLIHVFWSDLDNFFMVGSGSGFWKKSGHRIRCAICIRCALCTLQYEDSILDSGIFVGSGSVFYNIALIQIRFLRKSNLNRTRIHCTIMYLVCSAILDPGILVGSGSVFLSIELIQIRFLRKSNLNFVRTPGSIVLWCIWCTLCTLKYRTAYWFQVFWSDPDLFF